MTQHNNNNNNNNNLQEQAQAEPILVDRAYKNSGLLRNKNTSDRQQNGHNDNTSNIVER